MSHYFINDENLKKNEQKKEVIIFDHLYYFYTDNGVFSKGHLDYGTRLLLENLPYEKMSGNVLDVGCGYGPIGIIIASKNSNILVDMCDINENAINLVKKNIILNNIKNGDVFVSDVYSAVNKKYDYIVTNPPIRVGKEVLRKFLLGAKEYLNLKGELWFVMRKDHGVKSMMKELENYFEITVIEKSKGFYIIKAICR